MLSNNHWARKICPTIAVGLLLFLAACNFSDAPQPGQWIARRSMLIKRSWISMAIVHEKIYGIGGMTDADGKRLDLNQVYDPRANEWTQLEPMPTPRSSPGTAVIDDLIYVVGGYPEDDATNRVEVFDTINNRWLTDLPAMPTARHGLRLAYIDGLLYAIGGCLPDGNSLFDVARNEAYIVRTPTQTKLK